MKSQAPSFLRLHREGDATAAARPKRSNTDQFWNAFSEATGWRIDRQHSNAEEVEVLPAVTTALTSGLLGENMPPVVRENATKLAKMAKEMAGEIENLEKVVRRQEVELAASHAKSLAPTRSQSASEAVQQTLQRAITASGMNSAAIYLLDDNTEFLNTRAVVGLPMERLNAEPRTLRGSRADLEALVQDAVLMDDLYGAMGETWNAPEEAGAAVCTALFKDDLPIGTLWLFADEPRDLREAHATIAQMASTQITLQLADAAAVQSLERGQKSRETINHIAAWQYSSLPVGNHLAPGWYADGMIESPEDWAIGWHAWDIMPDGSLMLAIAEASEMGGEGAMVAATARAAMTSHSGYRHTPAQMLQRVGDTLWNTNTADQLVSMMYMRLDPETGEGEIAAAGRIGGLIAGRFGYRPLIGSVSRPLASSIDVDSYQSTFNLAAGETLVAYGAGLKSDGISQELLGCCLRSATQSKQKPLTMLRREMAAFPVRHERGLIALSRASKTT